MNKIVNFLKEVRVELAKVAWPTRQQTVKYTLVVLGMSLFLAIFLGTIDWFFQWVLTKYIVK